MKSPSHLFIRMKKMFKRFMKRRAINKDIYNDLLSAIPEYIESYELPYIRNDIKITGKKYTIRVYRSEYHLRGYFLSKYVECRINKNTVYFTLSYFNRLILTWLVDSSLARIQRKEDNKMYNEDLSDEDKIYENITKRDS